MGLEIGYNLTGVVRANTSVITGGYGGIM